jgi:hypothetical protein
MGVIVGRGGYQSEAAAEYAGKRALEDFLTELAKERSVKDNVANWGGLIRARDRSIAAD